MKRTALALLALSLFGSTAFAAGYTGPGATSPVGNVSAALEAADDTRVVLEGQIVKRLQDERYEFKDATGTIQVEIDDEDWPNQTVSETAKVRLTGEVDKDFNGREIDVDRVELIN